MDLKICGICNAEDLLFCDRSGVAYVGLNLVKSSSRALTIDLAIQIWESALNLKSLVVKPVLITSGLAEADATKISRQWTSAFGTKVIMQLHGDKDEAIVADMGQFFSEVWLAKKISKETDLNSLNNFKADLLILDGPVPGSGQAFEWELLKGQNLVHKWGLAGGINPSTIDGAIKIRPNLIDVSSGAESFPRKKDHQKIKMMVDAVQKFNNTRV